MERSWRYRLAAVLGTAGLTALSVALVNSDPVLGLASGLPVLGRLSNRAPGSTELLLEVGTATLVFLAALAPLYKPRPRRILDTITAVQKRVLLGVIALAGIGYFDYSYRLPRLTLLLAAPLLVVVLPLWFVSIRRRPAGSGGRAVVIGDDPGRIATVLDAASRPVLGYLCPTNVFDAVEAAVERVAVADGGLAVGRLGGLSRIDDTLVDYDIDTAILAFERPDRAEFFGALDACYDHGVTAKVHREQADSVITGDGAVEELLDVQIEPWDLQDYVLKRVFDVGFAVVGLVGLAPVTAVIAAAIKLEDGGPILYRQDRTSAFGETFTVSKFRSMRPDAEAGSGAVLSEEGRGGVDPRVTRVGRVLRRTHSDEIPQLWSVLIGDMSVVGPRPERPELESAIEREAEVVDWRKRWFVKPGLTGLAQINEVTGHEPEAKLRYDMQYIRRQAFWFDLKVVLRQVWLVLGDAWAVLRG